MTSTVKTKEKKGENTAKVSILPNEFFPEFHKTCESWLGKKIMFRMVGLNKYEVNLKKYLKRPKTSVDTGKTRSLGAKYIVETKKEDLELVTTITLGKTKVVHVHVQDLSVATTDKKMVSEFAKAEKEVAEKFAEIAVLRLKESYAFAVSQVAKEIEKLYKMAPAGHMVLNNIEDEVYHASIGHSKSQLCRIIAKTFSHYQFAIEEYKDTEAIRLGRVFHIMLLQPKQFKKMVYVARKVERRSTEGKQKWARILIENIDKEIITEDDYSVLSGWVRKIKNHPIASLLLKEGKFEIAFWYEHSGTKEVLRGKVDQIITNPSEELIETLKETMTGFNYNGEGILIDYKTFAKDLSDRNIEREKFERMYPVQAGQYREGMEAIYNKPFIFLYVFVEKTGPQEVRVTQEEEAAMEVFLDQRDDAIKKIVTHRNNPKLWKGYKLEIKTIGMPSYAFDALSKLKSA